MNHHHATLDYAGGAFARPDTPFLPAAETVAAATTLLGEDAVSVSALSPNLPVYGGYNYGTYDNYAALKAAHPTAKCISITPVVYPAMCLDVEPGNAGPSDCPAFFHQAVLGGVTGKPVVYTSAGDLQAVINAFSAAGIARTEYYLWSAHWIGLHICGPATCGYPQADGTQYASNNSYDSDVFNSYMFGALPVWPLIEGDIDPVGGAPLVKTLQENLNKWKYASPALATDGNFGPLTLAAVKNAQKVLKLTETGQVSQALYNELAAAVPPPPTAEWKYKPPSHLSTGVVQAVAVDVKLVWVAPAGAVEADVTGYHPPTGYEVKLFTSSVPSPENLPVQTQTVKTTSAMFADLTVGKTYVAQVIPLGSPAPSTDEYTNFTFKA